MLNLLLLLSKSQPLALGCDLGLGADLEGVLETVYSFQMNEGRLLEQFFWTVSKVDPHFILKALRFKGFAETSCS